MNAVALTSIVLRGLGLVGRFALTLYIAKFLGIAALASYGFFMGAVALVGVVSGLGLNAYIERTLVRLPALDALRLLSDRMLTRVLVAFALLAIGKALALLGVLALDDHFGLLAAIIIGEILALDLQRGLITRRRPILASAFLFIRSAAWIPITIALGMIDSRFRTFETVMGGWAASLAASFAVAAFMARRLPIGRMLIRPDWRRIGRTVRRARGAYLAEICGTATLYVDRYLVAAFLGIHEAGVFVFVWSITNAITSLIQAGYIHAIFPGLHLAWRSDDLAQWRGMVNRGMANVAMGGVVFAATVMFGTSMVLPLYGYNLAAENPLFTTLMIASVLVRLVADTLHEAIYSAERDRAWIMINIWTSVLLIPAGAACIAAFGLIGAGLMSLGLSSALFILRYRTFRQCCVRLSAKAA